MAQSWVRCAAEGVSTPGDLCSVPSPRQVRYGVPGAYKYRNVHSTVKCEDASFGAGATNYQNFCEYAAVASTTPAPSPAPAPAPAPTPAPTPAPAPSPSPSPAPAGTPGPRVTSFTASGPITATSGQVISGLRIQNPSGPCIVVPAGVSNVTIRDSEIGPCGGTGNVLVNGSSITIEYNDILSGARGIAVTNTSNVTVRRNKINGVYRGFSCGHPSPDFCSHNLEFSDVNGGVVDGNQIRGTMATDAVSMWQNSNMQLINNDIEVTLTHPHAGSFTIGDSLSGKPGRNIYVAGNVVRQSGGARPGVFGSEGNTVFEKNCFPNGMTVYNYSGVFVGITVRNNVINYAESLLPDIGLVTGWSENINSTNCALVPK